MAIQKIIKWNLLILTSIFLIACSDSGSDKPTTSRELEIPSGHAIVEGDDDSALLTLYFISPVDGPLSYSNFNITAAEKSDYEPISGTIQAEKGKEYAFDVVIFGDNEIEGDESFGINFKNDQNESVSSIVGKIENDDFPGVSVTSPQVLEGDSGVAKLVFTFSLSVAVVDDYSILITSTAPENLTDSQRSNYPYIALPGEDYQAVNQIVTFSSGELEKTLEVEVFAENIVEEDEVVLLAVVDAKGTPVLEDVYAKGIIRSDETKEVNGFNLSYDAAIELKNINEGTPAIDGPDIWIKTSLPISVVYPENIIQEQTLVFKVLSKTEAQSKGFIDEASEDHDYIDTSNKYDICFNSDESTNNDGCLLSNKYNLKPNDTSVTLDFFVRGDKNREQDEVYVIAVNNDQGVNFTNINGKIINDDSERLEIKVGDEFVDLINYTSANNIYEVNEPSDIDIDEIITLRLNTVLESGYTLQYNVKEHESAESNVDFVKVEEELLEFEINTGSQIKSIPIRLLSDKTYDGDKYIKVTFDNSNIESLIIKIKDSDFPKVGITQTNGDGIPVEVNGDYALLYEHDETKPNDHKYDYREYTYSLRMLGNSVAISDIRYKVVISTPANGDLPENTCISSSRSNKFSFCHNRE
ncbi:Calx-beta domain-containing protein [Pseudomonas sp. HK3]